MESRTARTLRPLATPNVCLNVSLSLRQGQRRPPLGRSLRSATPHSWRSLHAVNSHLTWFHEIIEELLTSVRMVWWRLSRISPPFKRWHLAASGWTPRLPPSQQVARRSAPSFGGKILRRLARCLTLELSRVHFLFEIWCFRGSLTQYWWPIHWVKTWRELSLGKSYWEVKNIRVIPCLFHSTTWAAASLVLGGPRGLPVSAVPPESSWGGPAAPSVPGPGFGAAAGQLPRPHPRRPYVRRRGIKILVWGSNSCISDAVYSKKLKKKWYAR